MPYKRVEDGGGDYVFSPMVPGGWPDLGEEEPAPLHNGAADLLVGLDLLLPGPDQPPLGLLHGPTHNQTVNKKFLCTGIFLLLT